MVSGLFIQNRKNRCKRVCNVGISDKFSKLILVVVVVVVMVLPPFEQNPHVLGQLRVIHDL